MHKVCPACKGNSISWYLKVTDYFLSSEEFELWKCDSCSFLFTHDPPVDDAIGKYYKSENYISHSNTKKGLINSLYHLARRFMLNRKQRIISKHSAVKKGRLLDIGTGTGYFPAYMNNKGWQSSGIEADKDAKEFAESNFGLDIKSLDDLWDFDSSSYDVVTLWHVLEHLSNPEKILREINRIISEKGICILALPNSDSFDAKYYKKYWAAWDVPRHLWHFNTESLTALARESGFNIISRKRMPLDAFYVSILSERYKSSGLGILKGAIIGKLGWIASIFRKSKSSSLIYILAKVS